MNKVIEDLKAAFAGESQANRRYLAYAKKADEDGFAQVAHLFRAAAHAETIHAHNHLRVLGEIHTTRENLEEAIKGENYEVVSMYPEFMKDAEAGDDRKALKTFHLAFEVEKVHENLFRQALANLGDQPELFDYYVCPVCGYTHAGSAPERCPVCGAPASRFERIS